MVQMIHLSNSKLYENWYYYFQLRISFFIDKTIDVLDEESEKQDEGSKD